MTGESDGPIDARQVVQTWGEIEDRGHPLGPAVYDDERSVDTDMDRSEGEEDDR